MRRRLTLLTLALLTVVAGTAAPAFAHNSLDSSSPAEGEVIAQQRDVLQWAFVNDVPLDTLTVTLTDPSGTRTVIDGSTHGADQRTVLTPLPRLQDGRYSARWRLVGADGHAVTGRVGFTVAIAGAGTSPDSSAPPTVTPPTDASPDVLDDESWSTPSGLEWGLRYGSYLALMVFAGLSIAEAFLWRRPAAGGAMTLMAAALAVIGVTAVLQIMTLAGTISGASPWFSASSLDRAIQTPSGMALAVRGILAVGAWLVMVVDRPRSPGLRSELVVVLSLALLATWSATGHARTLRWPWVGVPLDVVHHGAAAAWLGGLLIISVTFRRSNVPAEPVEMARRFSPVAATAVGLLVATGLVQAFRVHGWPASVAASAHGRLLLVKAGLLTVMLWLAARNRTVLRRDADRPADDAALLSRAVQREGALGLVTLAVTASLVVSSPD